MCLSVVASGGGTTRVVMTHLNLSQFVLDRITSLTNNDNDSDEAKKKRRKKKKDESKESRDD